MINVGLIQKIVSVELSDVKSKKYVVKKTAWDTGGDGTGFGLHRSCSRDELRTTLEQIQI